MKNVWKTQFHRPQPRSTQWEFSRMVPGICVYKATPELWMCRWLVRLGWSRLWLPIIPEYLDLLAFGLVGLLGSSLGPLVLLLIYFSVLTNCQRPPPAPPSFSQGISKGQHLRIWISRIQWNSHLDFIATHGCKTNSQKTAWQIRMLICFKNICPYSKAGTELGVGLFYNSSLRIDFY